VDQIRGHADVMEDLLVLRPQMKGIPEARKTAVLILLSTVNIGTKVNLPGTVDDETLQ
jgi:hypothetical protein